MLEEAEGFTQWAVAVMVGAVALVAEAHLAGEEVVAVEPVEDGENYG